jgi:flagellar biosynthesis/type III secretory pathway M-ring protein FliF/YscJ
VLVLGRILPGFLLDHKIAEATFRRQYVAWVLVLVLFLIAVFIFVTNITGKIDARAEAERAEAEAERARAKARAKRDAIEAQKWTFAHYAALSRA